VHLKFYVPKDEVLSLNVTGQWDRYIALGNGKFKFDKSVGSSTRTVLHDKYPNTETKIPGTSGWRTDGSGQVYKVMTSIAFPDTNVSYLNGDYDFADVKWANLSLNTNGTAQKPLTPDLIATGKNKPCATHENIVELEPPGATIPNKVSLRLRRLAKLETKPAIIFNLRANPRKDAQSRIIIKNTGVPKSILYYETTPLGLSTLTKGKLLQNAIKEVPFTVTCGYAPGTLIKKFDLVYSIGETFDKSVGSSKTGAQNRDLLYRTQPITVNLTCAKPVAQVTPPTLTLEASTPRGGSSAIAAGSSATKDSASLTIANVGDDGSILEYGRTRITTASTVAIVPILLPASVSSSDSGELSAQSITVTPKFTFNPNPAYDDWVYGTLNPTQTLTGTLEKLVGATVQDTYPAALECKKVGDSHDSYVVVPYLTGELDSSGVPLTGQQRVKVTSRCTGPVLEWTNGLNLTLSGKAGETVSQSIPLKNIGLKGIKKTDLAALEYSASLSGGLFSLNKSSGSVAVSNMDTLTVSATCSQAGGSLGSDIKVMMSYKRG